MLALTQVSPQSILIWEMGCHTLPVVIKMFARERGI